MKSLIKQKKGNFTEISKWSSFAPISFHRLINFWGLLFSELRCHISTQLYWFSSQCPYQILFLLFYTLKHTMPLCTSCFIFLSKFYFGVSHTKSDFVIVKCVRDGNVGSLCELYLQYFSFWRAMIEIKYMWLVSRKL